MTDVGNGDTEYILVKEEDCRLQSMTVVILNVTKFSSVPMVQGLFIKIDGIE